MAEDYLMLTLLVLFVGITINAQLHIDDVYLVMDVTNGVVVPPPTFLNEDLPRALRAIFANNTLSSIAVFGVKFNFLLFFRRLGADITEYKIFWWIVVLVTTGVFGLFLGLNETQCTLGSLETIFAVCTSQADIRRQWINTVVLVSLDAFNDLLILCFPFSILWRIRVSIRKKMVLAGVFSLTVFTIIVTVLRGTIYFGSLKADFTQPHNTTWVWFWFSMEIFTAYLIACLVSFRMLFVHNDKSGHTNRKREERHLPRSHQSRRRRLYDSLLETFRDWEGTSDAHSRFLNDTVPSGRLSVDFSRGEIWAGPDVDSGTTKEDVKDRGDSAAKVEGGYVKEVQETV